MNRMNSKRWARPVAWILKQGRSPQGNCRRAIYGALALLTTSICILLPLRGMSASNPVSR